MTTTGGTTRHKRQHGAFVAEVSIQLTWGRGWGGQRERGEAGHTQTESPCTGRQTEVIYSPPDANLYIARKH